MSRIVLWRRLLAEFIGTALLVTALANLMFALHPVGFSGNPTIRPLDRGASS